MVPALPQVGGTEVLILIVIVLLLFGAKRIPQLARALGAGTREFRKGASGAYDRDGAAREGRFEVDENPPTPEVASVAERLAKTE